MSEESLEKVTRLGKLVFVSGLWAAYGDVAKATGYGKGTGARALSNMNWHLWSRFARADGVHQSDDEAKNVEFEVENQEHMRLQAVFGYTKAPYPAPRRLTLPELLMFLGELEPTARLRNRLWARLDVARAKGTRADVDAVQSLIDQLT